jgi:hypothetical protein
VNSGSYSRLDRTVHRLVLGSRTVQRVSFDMECGFQSRSSEQTLCNKPVFVSGLARSGTTALLRTLYDTGEFESLTYRDMPFVLMPRFWASITRTRYKTAAPAERAHGDSVLVDFDSPEGFENVFWKTFSAHSYDRSDGLRPYEPSEEVLGKFRIYISSIAARSPGAPKRYLSKNNNNLIRLAGLQRAFPDAKILVMYRDPLRTAASSLRQHRRFCEEQKKDPFILQYMNLLEHYEFGLGHKPFRFGGQDTPKYQPADPDYWLSYWVAVYEYLLRANTSFHLVNYEILCTLPELALRQVFQSLGLAADPRALAPSLRMAVSGALPDFDVSLAERALALSKRLAEDRRNLICLD